MLNISPNSISKYVTRSSFDSLLFVESRRSGIGLIRLITVTLLILLMVMFIPWTQNIRAKGKVTTLKPEQRPQTIHSIIAGRIEKWYVQEGDFVHKGDTILFISEIKDAYFDPNLLDRTQQQVRAKELSVESYDSKVRALDNQVSALQQTADLKSEQARNKLQQAYLKVTSDSIDYEAAKINYNIAQEQFKRMEYLYAEGLRSKTQYENRKLTEQKAQAEMISAENHLLTTRNEVLNAKVELTSIQAQYRDEVAKAESEKFAALSSKFDAEATVTKLQNQYSNYSVRQGFYYILAPQDGYITKAINYGLGETVKEGQEIVSIMPADYTLAVEMYVRPIDLPLLERGQEVRLQFDGWPAIIFSGWPNASYGTYSGEIFAIDNFISDNGLFRVLIQQTPGEEPWPKALRIGGGAVSLVLLKDVPIWYELWRQVNGFPPDYYKISEIPVDQAQAK